MSADSFHHQVEKGMRAEKNVYDGQNFQQIINKMTILRMTIKRDLLPKVMAP